MTDQSTALATIDQSAPAQAAQSTAFSGIAAFESAQRMATLLSESRMVPQQYQGNIADALIALEVAQRIGASPLMVMQNLHIIHGRPSWSSQFVIAALNSCGRFEPLRFAVEGQGDARTCYAWTRDRRGHELNGPHVSIQMAKDEGWYGRNGSKWKTMPDLMIRYRAAKFFGNLYAPDVLMGMKTEDELNEIDGTANEAAEQAPTLATPEPAAETPAPATAPAPAEAQETQSAEQAPAKTVPLLDGDGQVIKEYQRGGDWLNGLENLLRHLNGGDERRAILTANGDTLSRLDAKGGKVSERVQAVRDLAHEQPQQAQDTTAPPAMAVPSDSGGGDMF